MLSVPKQSTAEPLDGKPLGGNPLIDELIEVYRKADRILALSPSLDREFVVQTLLFLKKSPKERLRRALLRGRFFKRTAGF